MIFRFENDVEQLNVLRKHVFNTKKRRTVDTVRVCFASETTRDFDDAFVELFIHPDCPVKTLVLSRDPQQTLVLPANLIGPIPKLLFHPDNRLESVALDQVTLDDANFESLALALSNPNSKVHTFDVAVSRMPPKGIRPVSDIITSPGNCIKNFTFRWNDLSDGDARRLAEALGHEACEVEFLNVGSFALSMDGGHEILKAFQTDKKRRAREIFLQCGTLPSHGLSIHSTILKLLTAPGSKLRTLGYNHINHRRGPDGVASNALEAIGIAMENENNRLENLIWTCNGPSALQLARALRHPSNRLQSLELDVRGHVDDVIASLGTSIAHTNNHLTHLALSCTDSDVGGESSETLACALQSPNNKLNQLQLQGPLGLASPIPQTLTHPCCRVRKLSLLVYDRSTEAIKQFTVELRRAVRRSLVNDFWLNPGPNEDFQNALESDWLAVLRTLLSVRQIPRLARSAPCRVVPWVDLISHVAQVLDWPMVHLTA